MTPLLIAFEGGDGSGKSTQARLLAERIDAVLTRQTGGTPLGQRIRDLTLHPDTAHISRRAEACLYMADRAENVEKIVEPALAAGNHVVTDRYAYSSLVYQGYGFGLDVEHLYRIADWAMNGRWPDVVVLLDVPLEIGAERVLRDGELDHYEEAGIELQRRVVNGYHQLAEKEPDRWRIVDGRGTPEEVSARVNEVLRDLIKS